MTMLTDAELFSHLPSRRSAELQRAIGRTLLDVRRVFVLGLDSFHRSQDLVKHVGQGVHQRVEEEIKKVPGAPFEMFLPSPPPPPPP